MGTREWLKDSTIFYGPVLGIKVLLCMVLKFNYLSRRLLDVNMYKRLVSGTSTEITSFLFKSTH